jgi:hypothetical protein
VGSQPEVPGVGSQQGSHTAAVVVDSLRCLGRVAYYNM